MHMLQFCLLLCSHADHVFNNYCVYKIKTIHTHKQYEVNTKGIYIALILHTEYSKLLKLKYNS